MKELSGSEAEASEAEGARLPAAFALHSPYGGADLPGGAVV